MVIFAIAVGLILVGLVFQYGTKIQALTWGTIFMIQPFCAVFFPVSVFPAFFQVIAYSFPVTYFFEWLRALHEGTYYSPAKVLGATVFNLVYLAVAAWIFSRQLASAKRTGQLVRNDL
jgi:ABC-2 type transport system permease protein